MPTIASTNSEAETEKNGTLASPATARASSVLPVPGGPRAARRAGSGRRAPVALRVLEEVDDLGELGLGLVDAGDVGEGDALVAALDAARLRAPERAERAHLPAAGAAREPDEQADEQDHRAEAEDQVHQSAAPGVDRRGRRRDLVIREPIS